jgi:multidrug efflux system outer membrane protein
MKYFVAIKKILIIYICSLALTGCMVGPDFRKPQMELPDRFRFSEDASEEIVNLKWWELFKDPLLQELVNTALSENKDVRIATARIEEARAALGFTRADMFPFIDIEAAANKGTLAGGRRSDTTDWTAFATPVASWELDLWGKLRRATESSRADLLASEYGLRSVQISLISEVVSTYFLLLDFHKRLEISERTLESRIESLHIIQRRFEEGIIAEIDVNQAQIQKETAAVAIPQNKRLIAQTEHALSVLVGSLPRQIKTGVDLYGQIVTPDIPVGLPSVLLERRPDILAAEYSFKAQSELIGVAVALRLPSIGLTGSLGASSSELSSMTSEGFVWSIGASLFGPILNFNKNISRVKIEEARTRQALYEYELTVLSAFRDVSDALNAISTYSEEIAAVRRQHDAAKNAEYLAKMRYDKGVSSYLEVLETERALFDVELQLSSTTQDYYNAYVALYKALGGGWISKQEQLDATEKQLKENSFNTEE